MTFAAKISGTGSAFPETAVTNDDIAQRLAGLGVETNDKWIRERTGIQERRHSRVGYETEQNSSLGLRAAKNALEMAGKEPGDIDQIIYATCSPDTLMPSTACWLQHKLGAPRAWAMDINAACSGFIYGLVTVEQFIRSGQTQTALVVGGEVLSQLVNWHDRTSCILFGDGAGAAIVEQVPADSERRLLSSRLLSNGNNWSHIHIPAGGTNMELTPERINQNLHKIHMNGRELFKTAVRRLTDFALEELAENNLTVETLDWFIPHQANIRIIDAVIKRLGIDKAKVLINLDRFGNTSAATVPTVLDEAVRDGRIQPGHTLLLDAFGAGLTYGAITLRW
jgi:3-oxoacyl-[acyl-carrier-protein] synthase III